MKHQWNKFKQLRLKAGLSQNDVSTALGFNSSQYISNIERDISGLPLKYVKKVSKMFAVDPIVLTNLVVEMRTDMFFKKLAREKKQAGL